MMVTVCPGPELPRSVETKRVSSPECGMKEALGVVLWSLMVLGFGSTTHGFGLLDPQPMVLGFGSTTPASSCSMQG